MRRRLEAEMCATGERERRQRADRNSDSLDQLHGTSLPASLGCPSQPFALVLPRMQDPHRGDTLRNYRVTP
jgi:hypothetical protein